jgi:hypothetical protein
MLRRPIDASGTILRYSAIPCLVLISLLAQACSNIPHDISEATGVVIEGAVIRNELAFPVTDVQLLVPASGNFVGCGNIMARSQCSTTFPERDYHANAVVISWKERGQPHSTGEFVIEIPEKFDFSRPARLEVIIFNLGQAGAKLVQ